MKNFIKTTHDHTVACEVKLPFDEDDTVNSCFVIMKISWKSSRPSLPCEDITHTVVIFNRIRHAPADWGSYQVGNFASLITALRGAVRYGIWW